MPIYGPIVSRIRKNRVRNRSASAVNKLGVYDPSMRDKVFTDLDIHTVINSDAEDLVFGCVESISIYGRDFNSLGNT